MKCRLKFPLWGGVHTMLTVIRSAILSCLQITTEISDKMYYEQVDNRELKSSEGPFNYNSWSERLFRCWQVTFRPETQNDSWFYDIGWSWSRSSKVHPDEARYDWVVVYWGRRVQELDEHKKSYSLAMWHSWVPQIMNRFSVNSSLLWIAGAGKTILLWVIKCRLWCLILTLFSSSVVNKLQKLLDENAGTQCTINEQQCFYYYTY